MFTATSSEPGSFMEPVEPSATEIIHDKIRLRVLPAVAPSATWARLGAGSICDGCDGEIGPNDLEHELLLADGGVLHLHARCAFVWEALRTALMSQLGGL